MKSARAFFRMFARPPELNDPGTMTNEEYANYLIDALEMPEDLRRFFDRYEVEKELLAGVMMGAVYERRILKLETGYFLPPIVAWSLYAINPRNIPLGLAAVAASLFPIGIFRQRKIARDKAIEDFREIVHLAKLGHPDIYLKTMKTVNPTPSLPGLKPAPRIPESRLLGNNPGDPPVTRVIPA